MKYSSPLYEGKILKRYKRFLADIQLKNGETITAHTPNTGSMKTCWEPGWKVMVSHHDNPKRKLKYGLELTHNGKTWIGVNTNLPNRLAYEAISKGVIQELSNYDNIRSEIKVGKSRIDLLLSKEDELCYVEIKNVTLIGENNAALFPDSISERGQKHLEELISLKKQGHRAVMLYIVQRQDVDHFRPAWNIDKKYSELVLKAQESGVEILAYQCQIDPEEVIVSKKLPCFLEPTGIV